MKFVQINIVCSVTITKLRSLNYPAALVPCRYCIGSDLSNFSKNIPLNLLSG